VREGYHHSNLMRPLLLLSTLATWALFASIPAHAEAPEPSGLQTCNDTRAFHDGDTFTCISEQGPLRVRVAGIDAPEVGQGYWRISRDLLRSNTPPGSEVDCYKTDRYKRQVCRVISPVGQDIALSLVEAGLAWHTVKYRDEQTPDEQVRYATAEGGARSVRRGLWSQPQPQSPWDCREGKKARQRCY